MPPADQVRPLYRFAYIPVIHERTEELAGLAEPEEWNYRPTPQAIPRPILYNYLHYTFARLEEEEKIAITDDSQVACFNTGLVTINQEPLFMLFERNRQAGADSPWYFQRFVRKGEGFLNRFRALPQMAHYFDDPSDLVYDSRLDLRANVEHIVGDNRERFPDPFRSMDSYVIQTVLKGALDNATERVRRNYKAAIPQFYQGRIQLLLPLCLGSPQLADLAIVVEKFDGFYRASTCLTLDMAYNNARQLAKPDRDWLQS
jgi:hypothetical protein